MEHSRKTIDVVTAWLGSDDPTPRIPNPYQPNFSTIPDKIVVTFDYHETSPLEAVLEVSVEGPRYRHYVKDGWQLNGGRVTWTFPKTAIPADLHSLIVKINDEGRYGIKVGL